jgi:hypothetical protein
VRKVGETFRKAKAPKKAGNERGDPDHIVCRTPPPIFESIRKRKKRKKEREGVTQLTGV